MKKKYRYTVTFDLVVEQSLEPPVIDALEIERVIRVDLECLIGGERGLKAAKYLREKAEKQGIKADGSKIKYMAVEDVGARLMRDGEPSP